MASSNKQTRFRTAAAHAPVAVVPPHTFNTYSSNMRTHEGGQAPLITDLEALRRAVLSCLLWEDQFYESGVDIADRIANLIPLVNPEDVYNLALEARNVMKLRHVPLLVATEMLKYPEHKKLVRKLTAKIIQRPDEITEILSIYWRKEINPTRNKEGKFISQRAASGRKIPMQLLRGCRDAFAKFDQYQMLKWQERGNPVTMADAIRLLHPDPTLATRQSPSIDIPMKDVYASIIMKTALAPDTWESRLSASGKEAKKSIFTDMLARNELASLALISNLRGMIESGVDIELVRTALAKMNVERVLPYRFITAARYAPSLKSDIQAAMFRCVESVPKLSGKTVLLVDISSSMSSAVSRRPNGRVSDLRRVDAAAGLCILAQSICQESIIYLFNTNTYKVTDRSIEPAAEQRRTGWHDERFSGRKSYSEQLVGFTLSEAISSLVSGGTDLSQAVEYINRAEDYTRLIVFTDDESSTTPPPPKALGYGINVASGSCGVTYDSYVHINGFSEGTLFYVTEYEKQLARLLQTS